MAGATGLEPSGPQMAHKSTRHRPLNVPKFEEVLVPPLIGLRFVTFVQILSRHIIFCQLTGAHFLSIASPEPSTPDMIPASNELPPPARSRKRLQRCAPPCRPKSETDWRAPHVHVRSNSAQSHSGNRLVFAAVLQPQGRASPEEPRLRSAVRQYPRLSDRWFDCEWFIDMHLSPVQPLERSDGQRKKIVRSFLPAWG